MLSDSEDYKVAAVCEATKEMLLSRARHLWPNRMGSRCSLPRAAMELLSVVSILRAAGCLGGRGLGRVGSKGGKSWFRTNSSGSRIRA